MSESTSTVECPICGETFDPTAAGGWCTNPDCGEWQYEGDEVPDPAEGAEESRTEDGPEAVEQQEREAEDEEAQEIEEEEAEEPEEEEAQEIDVEEAKESEGADEREAGAEETQEPEEEEAQEREEEETHDSAEEAEPAVEGEIECPNCETTLSADANFCSNCGKDVADVEPGESEELSECPACGADVDANDNFCASCGENLDAYRADPLTECPECGEDVDEDDRFCASCGEDLDPHRAGEAESEQAEGDDEAETETDADASPETLVLEVRGREIEVEDGDVVGRDVRRALTETGGDEEDAVLIHREHLRFVREDGQFLLEDLGENPTTLEGRSLQKGDREPVAPGDKIGLSGVVTMTVREP